MFVCVYVYIKHLLQCFSQSVFRTDILTLFPFLSISQVQKQVPLCVWQPLQVQLEALGQVGHPDRPQRARVLQRRRKGGVRNECADSGSPGALRTKTVSLKEYMRWFVSFNDNKPHWKFFAAVWTFSELHVLRISTITSPELLSTFHYLPFHPSLTCKGQTDN